MQMESWVQTIPCTTKNVITIKLSLEPNIESLNN